MLNQTTYPLNHARLNEILKEQAIKQWWLADELHVDRKTVSRWVSGKVLQIQESNINALAKLLKCPLSELILSNDIERPPTNENLQVAAHAIIDGNFISLFDPSGNYHIAEKIIKIAISPAHSPAILAALYNKLSIACWRQSKITEAESHAARALDLSKRANIKNEQIDALISLANIHSWNGFQKIAIADYRQVLMLIPNSEKSKRRAAILSNLGATLFEYGDLEEGLKCQNEALGVFKFLKDYVGLSICYSHLASILLEQNVFSKAQTVIRNASLCAKKANYQRGIAFSELQAAELAAHLNEKKEAITLTLSALSRYESLQIKETQNYVLASYIYLLVGELKKAERELCLCEKLNLTFPIERAFYHMQKYRLLLATKNLRAAKAALIKAKELFLQSGCELRA